jgi:hypothetical protein
MQKRPLTFTQVALPGKVGVVTEVEPFPPLTSDRPWP